MSTKQSTEKIEEGGAGSGTGGGTGVPITDKNGLPFPDYFTDVTKRLWNALPPGPDAKGEGGWTSLSEWDEVLGAVADGADLNAWHKHHPRTSMKPGLHEAIRLCAPLSVVEAMVEAGGDVHAADENGGTTLLLASCYRGSYREDGLAVIKYLVSKDVDHTKRHKDNWLPIHLAGFYNSVPVLRYWIEEKHVNPDEPGSKDGKPLYVASWDPRNANTLDAVGYLAVCANANPLAKNNDGSTPVDKANDDNKQFLELWTQPSIQTIINAWRHNNTPPTSVSSDMYDQLFHPNSPGEDRLSVLRFIARHHQTSLTVRCVMAGMTGVGKTSLVTKAVKPESTTTVDGGEAGRTRGLDVTLQSVSRGVDTESGDQLPSCNIVWQDFGGHVEYWALQGGFLGWDCVVFVAFDLQAAVSAMEEGTTGNEEVGLWLDSIGDKIDWERGSSVGLVLVGTKSDLVSEAAAAESCLEYAAEEYRRRAEAWGLKAEEVRRRQRERALAELAGAAMHSPPSSDSTTTSPADASPIKLLACTTVSSVTGKASLLPPFRRPGTPSVTDIPSLLLYVLDVAPEYLPGYFGVERAPSEIRASERVLGTSGPSRTALFGGRWAMGRAEYASMARDVLDLASDTDMTAFTGYMVSVGAFLTCGDVVVVDPSRVAGALASVVSHRYVGLKHHDPVTATELASDGCDPSVMAEFADVAKLRSKFSSDDATELVGDELQFVTESKLSRRLLRHVLLHPDHPRCLLSDVTEGEVEAVWEMLQTFEYGVLLCRDVVFLPFLYTLREIGAGEETLAELGIRPCAKTGRLLGAMATRVGQETSWVMERRFVVGRLPWRAFGSILHGVLSPSLEWARVRESVSPRGLMVHVTSGVTGVSGLVEHVVVWVQGSESWSAPSTPTSRSRSSSSSRSRSPSPSPSPRPPPSPFAAQTSPLALRLQGECEVRVASWYEGCTSDTLSGLCYGMGGSFGDHPPWLGFVETLGIARSSLSNVVVTESAHDFRASSWLEMEEVEEVMSRDGVHGGDASGNMMHLMGLRELDGGTAAIPDPPLESTSWRCVSCQRQRQVGPASAPSSSSSSEPWIIPGGLPPAGQPYRNPAQYMNPGMIPPGMPQQFTPYMNAGPYGVPRAPNVMPSIAAPKLPYAQAQTGRPLIPPPPGYAAAEKKTQDVSVPQRVVNFLVPDWSLEAVRGLFSKILPTAGGGGDELAVETEDTITPTFACDICHNRDQNNFIRDAARGDTICLGKGGSGCGNVVQDHQVHEGSQYRKFEGEEDKSHHGPAPNGLFSTGYNLRTQIGKGDKDSNQLQRLADCVELNLSQFGKDERRTRVGYKDQMKRKAFERIAHTAANLELHMLVADRANQIFAQFRDYKEHVHHFQAVVAASIIAAYEQVGKMALSDRRAAAAAMSANAALAAARMGGGGQATNPKVLYPFGCPACPLRFNDRHSLRMHGQTCSAAKKKAASQQQQQQQQATSYSTTGARSVPPTAAADTAAADTAAAAAAAATDAGRKRARQEKVPAAAVAAAVAAAAAVATGGPPDAAGEVTRPSRGRASLRPPPAGAAAAAESDGTSDSKRPRHAHSSSSSSSSGGGSGGGSSSNSTNSSSSSAGVTGSDGQQHSRRAQLAQRRPQLETKVSTTSTTTNGSKVRKPWLTFIDELDDSDDDDE